MTRHEKSVHLKNIVGVMGVTRGKGGHNSQGAESLRGNRKVPTKPQVFLQYSTFAFEKAQVRTWGRQTCFLHRALSNLVTPMVGAQCSWASASQLWVFPVTLQLLLPARNFRPSWCRPKAASFSEDTYVACIISFVQRYDYALSLATLSVQLHTYSICNMQRTVWQNVLIETLCNSWN